MTDLVELRRLWTGIDIGPLERRGAYAYAMSEFLKVHMGEIIAELEELRKDKARLDWLEREFITEKESWRHEQPFYHPLFRKNAPITRSAIDAAMKEVA